MDFQSSQFIHVDPSDSGITVLNPKASPLFDHARLLCTLASMFARLANQDRRLLTLGNVTSAAPSNVAKSAVQVIPIRAIKGTLNRCDDFDKDFYPLHDRFSWRWIRIASMMLQGTPLPPVELAQVGKEYFVIDGHHRISVAKMLKYTDVEAVITAVYARTK